MLWREKKSTKMSLLPLRLLTGQSTPSVFCLEQEPTLSIWNENYDKIILLWMFQLTLYQSTVRTLFWNKLMWFLKDQCRVWSLNINLIGGKKRSFQICDYNKKPASANAMSPLSSSEASQGHPFLDFSVCMSISARQSSSSYHIPAQPISSFSAFFPLFQWNHHFLI